MSTVPTPLKVSRTLALSLLARVPLGALGLLLILEVRGAGHSYAIAGLASAAWALGMAAGAPVVGRLIDRLGQTAVLLATSGGAALVLAGFLAMPRGAPVWPFLVLASFAGWLQPPVSACARVIWRARLDPDRFGSVLTLDASLQEAAFVAGPLVLIPVATAASPAAALAVLGVLLAGSTIAFAMLPESRRVRPALRAHRASGVGPLAHAGVRTLLILALALGLCFGATELGIIVAAETFHVMPQTGLLYGAWGIGGLIGGLVASRRVVRAPLRKMGELLLVLAGTSALLAAAPTPVVLGLLLAAVGAVIPSLFGIMYGFAGDIAPPGTLTEVFALQTSGVTAGIALGSAGAGLATGVGSGSAFFVSSAGALVAGVLLWARRSTLRARPEIGPDALAVVG